MRYEIVASVFDLRLVFDFLMFFMLLVVVYGRVVFYDSSILSLHCRTAIRGG